MSWNYRMVRNGDLLGIAEVHYTEHGSISGVTDPVPVTAGNEDEPGTAQSLQWQLERMTQALAKPAIKWDGVAWREVAE